MGDKAAELPVCPSAQPDMEGAAVFGIVNGTPEVPRVSYLKKEAVVDLDRLPDLGPLKPGHLFRISATCEKSRCIHFSGERCMLAQRIVDKLPPVVDRLPPCQIRRDCRWHAEQGPAACYRCPQIVTYAAENMHSLVDIAVPASTRVS